MLSRDLKKNDLNVPQAQKGSYIASRIDELQYDDYEKFLEEIVSLSRRRNLLGHQVVDYVNELYGLSQRTGKSYTQLIQEVDEVTADVTGLRKLQGDLQEKIEESRKTLEAQLRNADTTLETLEEYLEITQTLAGHGVKISQIERVANLANNLREHGYNVEAILDYYDKGIATRDVLEREQKRSSELQEANTRLVKENSRLEAEVKNKGKICEAAGTMLKAGLEAGDALAITETVLGLRRSLDVSPREAIDRFLMDVRTGYRERTGYRFKGDDLEHRLNILEDSVKALEERKASLEGILEARSSAHEALRAIQELGVSDVELVEWKWILGDQGYDVESFRVEVEKLDGVEALTEEKLSNIRKLETRERGLQALVQSLEDRVEELRETILETLREANTSITEASAKLGANIDNFERYFTNPETGLESRTRKTVDESRRKLHSILVEADTRLKKELDEITETVDKITKEYDAALQNAFKGGAAVARFHSLEPIHSILRGEEPEPTEAKIAVITMLTYISQWAGKAQSLGFKQSVDQILGELMETPV